MNDGCNDMQQKQRGINQERKGGLETCWGK